MYSDTGGTFDRFQILKRKRNRTIFQYFQLRMTVGIPYFQKKPPRGILYKAYLKVIAVVSIVNKIQAANKTKTGYHKSFPGYVQKFQYS